MRLEKGGKKFGQGGFEPGSLTQNNTPSNFYATETDAGYV